MAITQDWKIRSRSHSCSHTGEPFTDGDEFYTALFADPKTGELTRQDLSLDAWNAIRESLDPFSFWKTTYEAPPPPDAKPEVVEKESAESILRRLIEENEPHTENARYILAIMLERKKQLRQTDTKFTEQNKLLIYENPKSGEVFIVLDPQLKLDEVERVQAEVSDLLGGGKKDTAEEAESTGPATGPEGSAPQPTEPAPTAASDESAR